jgi:GTP diphosphokinase / guanosine-3',5'-bis(diphosphate) 3'-diphosphatase
MRVIFMTESLHPRPRKDAYCPARALADGSDPCRVEVEYDEVPRLHAHHLLGVPSEEQSMNDGPALILDAAAFAADKHRNQRRKDKGASPYINHPIGLAALLANDGGVSDARVLAAALLHDTIEDTETTAAELEERFGSAIKDIVLEVTDDKSLPKAERKQLQVAHAPHISREAKLVKLADKICNLRDILASPPADWPASRKQQYFEWAHDVVAGLRGTNAALEAIFDDLYRRRGEFR